MSKVWGKIIPFTKKELDFAILTLDKYKELEGFEEKYYKVLQILNIDPWMERLLNFYGCGIPLETKQPIVKNRFIYTIWNRDECLGYQARTLVNDKVKYWHPYRPLLGIYPKLKTYRDDEDELHIERQELEENPIIIVEGIKDAMRLSSLCNAICVFC